MRILITLSCLLAIFSINVHADDMINEQQIMLYYQIPLSTSNIQDNRHQFGLRFDRVAHAPGEEVPLGILDKKTAAIDIRMNYEGIHSVKVRGVDYGPYLIARAAEGDPVPANVEPAAAATAETAPATTEAQPAEAATAEGETAATAEVPKSEKTIVQKTLENLPFGVIFGSLLGVYLLIGVDN